MAKKHLLLNPHKVTNDFWWYEENQGISICTQAFTKIGCPVTKIHNIPWRAIRPALARKDKK